MYPHANDLYFNILRMCPHNEARAGFEHLFESAKAAGEPDNELCAMLAFRLVDALRYGNWPEAPPPTVREQLTAKLRALDIGTNDE